jgi:hypothetical protein
MTGTMVVQPALRESASATPGGRPAVGPVSGAAFLLLLAQLLQGSGGAAPTPLAQQIDAPPDGLEGKASGSPESPRPAESEPAALAALAMALPLPLKALPPPTGPAASGAPQAQAAEPPAVRLVPAAITTSGPRPSAAPAATADVGSRHAAAALMGEPALAAQEAALTATPAPEAAGPPPTAVPVTEPLPAAPGLDRLQTAAPGPTAPARPQDVPPALVVVPTPPSASAMTSPAPAPVSQSPRVEKAVGAPAPAAVAAVADAVPAARTEDTGSPVPSPQGLQTAPDARPAATLTVGAAGRAELRDSPDRDEAGDKDRGRREPADPVGGGLAGPAAAAHPPTAAAPEEGAPPDPAAVPRSVVEQVTERIGLIRREGRHEVSLRLEPPELGTVHIEAVLEGQHLTLQIRTELEPARAALEQALPQLKESLSQQGIVAGHVTVQLGLDASAREFPGQGFAEFRRPALEEPAPRPSGQTARPARWHEPSPQGFDLWV